MVSWSMVPGEEVVISGRLLDTLRTQPVGCKDGLCDVKYERNDSKYLV